MQSWIMAEHDEAEQFFAQAQADLKRSSPQERTGLMVLPETYRRMLMDYVGSHFSNTRVFKALTGTVFPTAGKFEDKAFPHTESSLIKYWPMADLPSRDRWATFTWQRLSDLFPNFTLLTTITPSDIVPGCLGNSYFLSALSALAERPERVRRLFVTQTKNEKCQYKLTIMDLGQWKEFLVDDYFPCEGSELAFSSSNAEEEDCDVWVSLLEKVWAKKYGSYYDIQSGYSDEALTDLTGAPCQAFPTSDPNLWTRMVESNRKRHIITADSAGGGVSSEAVTLGLEVEHCYAVISVVEVQAAGGPLRLLQIRNPWKSLEWTGDWSDSSPLWTPQLKKAANYSEEEGAFWMNWTDFGRFFATVRICMTEDTYWTQSLPMDQTKEEEFSVVEVVLSRPTDLYFMTSQVDDRRFGGLEGGYSYSPVRFLACQLTKSASLRYITGALCPASRDAYIHLPGLTAGTYLVYVEFQWKSELTDLFGVSVYSSEPVNLRDVTADWTDYIPKCANRDTLHPATILETELILYQTVTLKGTETGSSPPNVYIDWYENKSSQPLQVTIKHQPWQNMTTCPAALAPTGQAVLSLQPGEVQSVVKKQKRMEAGHGFKVLVKREVGRTR